MAARGTRAGRFIAGLGLAAATIGYVTLDILWRLSLAKYKERKRRDRKDADADSDSA